MSAYSELKKDGLTKRHTPWVKRPNRSQVSDEELARAAAEAIEWLTTIPQGRIKVIARNGWLHLDGTVDRLHQRTTLEEVTRHLPGVKGVIDSITINAVPTQAELRTLLR
jgi:osmotically-inducible protein OsmY